MIGLTPQQARLLQFLKDRQAAGVSPTFEEMAAHLGLATKSGAFRVLQGLEERGYVRRLQRRHRAVEIIDRDPLAGITTEAMIAELARRGIEVVA